MPNRASQRKKQQAIYRRRRIVVFGGGFLALILIITLAVAAWKWISKPIGESGSSQESSQSSSQETLSGESSSADSSSEDTSSDSPSEQEPSSQEEPSSSEPSSSKTQSTSSSQANAQSSDWKLILVNAKNPLPESFKVDLVTISGQYKFDSRAADALRQMLADAKAAGQPMVLRSTYRTRARSEELYNNKVQEYINSGYSKENAKVEAAKWIAPPGTSEHHTGLAVDLVSEEYNADNWDLLHEFENYKGFTWLKENCTKYGFILRYPKDKQNVTNITYEPWHYRYVGKEAAEYITSHGLCLEEYLEQVS